MSTYVSDRLRQNLPDDFRQQNAEAFMAVLDGVNDLKQEALRKASRLYCPPLLTSLPYLRKRAEDVGWPDVPYDFPKEILDAMVLNAEAVFSAAGSYRGLDYWLRVLTQGEMEYSGDFLSTESYIIPGDSSLGHLSDDAKYGTANFVTLFSGSADDVTPGGVDILCKTPYDTLKSLKPYILSTIRQILGFTGASSSFSITLVNGPYKPNPYANPYFVIQP